MKFSMKTNTMTFQRLGPIQEFEINGNLFSHSIKCMLDSAYAHGSVARRVKSVRHLPSSSPKEKLAANGRLEDTPNLTREDSRPTGCMQIKDSHSLPRLLVSDTSDGVVGSAATPESKAFEFWRAQINGVAVLIPKPPLRLSFPVASKTCGVCFSVVEFYPHKSE